MTQEELKECLAMQRRIAALCREDKIYGRHRWGVHLTARAYESLYGQVEDFTPPAEQVAEVVPYYPKQASWEWRMGKTPAFDLELDTRFPWGGVQLQFTLKSSLVEQLEVYSDALDPDLAQKLRGRLLGCRFDSRVLHDALLGSGDPHLDDLAQFLLAQNL